MRSYWVSALLLGLASVGCQNQLYDENVKLHNQNRELQQRLTETDARAKSTPDSSAQMQQMEQAIAERDARIAELQAQLSRPAPESTPEESNLLRGIEVTRDDAAGTMTVNLPGDVLFSSGSADVKSSARATLDKVIAAVKKDYGGKKVIVRGHTDSDPISKTKDKWEDNLDLSAARARSVRAYLTQHGLDARNVQMQAYGETLPRGNKDRSRRVEIVVATR